MIGRYIAKRRYPIAQITYERGISTRITAACRKALWRVTAWWRRIQSRLSGEAGIDKSLMEWAAGDKQMAKYRHVQQKIPVSECPRLPDFFTHRHVWMLLLTVPWVRGNFQNVRETQNTAPCLWRMRTNGLVALSRVIHDIYACHGCDVMYVSMCIELTPTPQCSQQRVYENTIEISKLRINHGGTTEEGNCSYLLPLSHRVNGPLRGTPLTVDSLYKWPVMRKALHRHGVNMYNEARRCCTLTSNTWKTLIMMMSSNGNMLCVTGPLCGEFTRTGEFPSQRPVTQNFDLRPNKQLSKQSRRQWFETPSHSLWRHCNFVMPGTTGDETENSCIQSDVTT